MNGINLNRDDTNIEALLDITDNMKIKEVKPGALNWSASFSWFMYDTRCIMPQRVSTNHHCSYCIISLQSQNQKCADQFEEQYI